MPSLKTELWLPASLEEVWDFHKDPNNLLKITPSFFRMRLHDVPPVVGKGAEFEITSENKLLSSFMKWSVKYLDWGEQEDLKFFVDTQTQGPFESWVHRHEFKRGVKTLEVDSRPYKSKEPGTWVLDSLDYTLKGQLKPFTWVAEKMITQLFVYRKRRLEKLFTPKAN
jgi:ligand-binding SRPBCC domain-containing protein